ncbi:unnamed protein product [Symbiodinium natans]|uniref:Uncharacterized protein n=1 Tax=Symbiodinium natans TaxID=878477 RepID=A0A812RVG5_9DINO|nr:unnamed protein product [Symbiodinium natans]
MELARLRTALGEGRTLELEIDKLRALLGAIEADVRILRQVKQEKGELRDCTDGEFILRSPERRKRMLTQAVQSHALIPEAEAPKAAPPPFHGKEPAAVGPHPSVPQGLRSVRSAVELRQPLLVPGVGRRPLSPISAGSLPTPGQGFQPVLAKQHSHLSGPRHHATPTSVAVSPVQRQPGNGLRLASPPLRPGPPGAAWKGGAVIPPEDSTPAQLAGREQPASSHTLLRTCSSSASSGFSNPASATAAKIPAVPQPGWSQLGPDASSDSWTCQRGVPRQPDRHCWYCGQLWPDNQSMQGHRSRESSVVQPAHALQATGSSDLLQRLEAAGIGPWQIAELKASEARLAEIAAQAPGNR